MCHTGRGKTCHPSQTPACDGCLESPVTQGFVPTWREPKLRVSKPTPARPPPMASSVKNPLVRQNEEIVKGGVCSEERILQYL